MHGPIRIPSEADLKPGNGSLLRRFRHASAINFDLQLRAQKSAGCEQVFQDQVSGSVVKRPGLNQARAGGAADVLPPRCRSHIYSEGSTSSNFWMRWPVFTSVV